MLKKFIFIFLLFVLNNCSAPTSVFLGPSITVATTGNFYRAGLSYGSSKIIKKTQESIKKIKETKTLIHERVDQLHMKSKDNKIVMGNKAEDFFKAVKNSLNK